MRQIVNSANGSYDVLEVKEVPDLVPEADHLIIDVKASGLNFADILARKGQYPDAPPKPCVLGYEVAGTVRSQGDAVEGDWRGRPVIAFCRFKGQAEQVRVRPAQVFPKPERLSWEQAAALPVNYLTAWMLLVAMGALKSHESVLIQNAGGGVGLAELEIATHIGATTYGTASARKHDFLAERGLHHAIDYRNDDWYEVLMELTGGRGVDLVTDPLGGKEWKRGYKALCPSGRLGMFGISTASTGPEGGLRAWWNLARTALQMPIFHPLSLLNNNRGVFGVNLGHLWGEQKKANTWMEAILQGVDEGWISPHVDATFPFAEAGEAHRYIEERRNIGKVILVP